MDVLLSAVLGELITRSINFIISKYSKPMPLDVKDCLRRLLLRAQVIIDEAMGRHITNQPMLLRLVMLSDAMHRGYYVLDAIRYQHHDEEDAKDQVVSRSSSLSIVNSVKHLCFSSRAALPLKELQETLDNLSSMIRDVNELVLYLASYPRLCSQPYSMHLQLANCMFGCQIEAQLVINFLLNTQPHGAEKLEVLPIVGPRYVGKSTLVANVCKDERVFGHFSNILFFRIHGFTDDEVATFREGCATKLQNHMSDSNKDGRLLVVVELDGDVSEEALNRLFSASRQYVPRGSKIILTSRFDNIVKFGTTKPLNLKHPSREAYWYFFKTLTFGSTDPEMHPRLTHLAMEIAKVQRSCFLDASIVARLLRDNFNGLFWSKVLAFFRCFIQQRVSRFGQHPFDLLGENRIAHIGRMAAPSEDVVIYHQHQRSSEEEVPKIRMDDVIYGSVKPHGKFEVLVWKSQIPPYYSHVYTCEIPAIKNTGAKRKRSMGRGM
ncbi:putative disease resistance protein RGA3 [Panicum virgatum]|uniref:NB-ARC domain-containing protein n=1 Tax=Panicum virgatum TaxID=38727 RepID=A0A8T0W744_PANVG|nr:putative disease resistance protein RGA3 [Panicum virgatum]KAG2640483.1 hypothetical protein PVAP13_2KG096532 [Panicum virgatum]